MRRSHFLLPEGLRLANRTDIHDLALKSRCQSTIVNYKRVMILLMESTQALGKVPGEVGHGLQYLREDAELPEPAPLKQFLIYVGWFETLSVPARSGRVLAC